MDFPHIFSRVAPQFPRFASPLLLFLLWWWWWWWCGRDVGSIDLQVLGTPFLMQLHTEKRQSTIQSDERSRGGGNPEDSFPPFMQLIRSFFIRRVGSPSLKPIFDSTTLNPWPFISYLYIYRKLPIMRVRKLKSPGKGRRSRPGRLHLREPTPRKCISEGGGTTAPTLFPRSPLLLLLHCQTKAPPTQRSA